LLAIALFACGGMRFVDQPIEGARAFVREVVDVLEPDRVPPLEFPALTPASASVSTFGRTDAVVTVVLGDDARAYPLRILVWHEVVNDTVGGTPVAVTYSPLSDSAVAFDRQVGDRTITFGTSGKLYRASLVLYDRETTSLWPQLMGAAAAGPMKGRRLERVALSRTSLGAFADAYPNGRVLRDPSFLPAYDHTPYAGYSARSQPSRAFFLREADRRLSAMRRVAGVTDGDRVVAYPIDAVENAGVINDGGVTLLWHSGVRSVLDEAEIGRATLAGAAIGFRRVLDGRVLTFGRSADGSFTDKETGSRWDGFGRAVAGRLAGRALEPVITTQAFWFAWATFNPSTLVFGVG
jgi:uncharacterized protein DUF3179